MSTVTFKIAEETFLNNGNLIIPYIFDKSNTKIQTAVTNWLCQSYTLIDKRHTTKSRGTWMGFDAGDINTQLRSKMTSINGIHGETHVEYGGLFHSSKEGFDFSLYDEDYNYILIRDYCIGNPGIYNGDAILDSIYKKLRTKSDDSKKMKKKDWKTILSSITAIPGQNSIAKKPSFTVVGEIQFGNWALGEHDLLRLINLSVKNSIDFYIYITPTGNLATKVSDGVVTYDKILQAISENSQLLSIPMWIIGLDI